MPDKGSVAYGMWGRSAAEYDSIQYASYSFGVRSQLLLLSESHVIENMQTI